MTNRTVAQSINLGMDTVITHSVYGIQPERILKAASEETSRLEGMLSRFISGSDISRINRSAGKFFEKVNDETFEVLAKAVEFSKYSEGRFDVTIGPLVDLWKHSRITLCSPDEFNIRKGLTLVNIDDLKLDPIKKTVCLRNEGQSIDLGGIGKGFAADLVIKVMRHYEVTSAYTNFGGNVAVIGSKPDGSPWRVGIQHPRKENSLIGAVSVINKSVVTSGDYQRYFIDRKGRRNHHILDPKTGHPSDSGLISATVISDNSAEADALSTILFISGIKKGMRILKSFPETEAILVASDMSLYVTRGIGDSFQAADDINVKIIG